MKIVGITLRVDSSNPYHERRDALDQRWYPFLKRVGACPLLIPNETEAGMRILEKTELKGLILSGGNTLMGLPGGDAPERDELETALLKRCCEIRLPVLGVCRGMQMIQKFFGCTLEAVSGHAGSRHIATDGRSIRTVNSYHTFGARASVPELKVLRTSPDGLIEETRHVELPVRAIMWHPERESVFEDEDLKLFSEHFG